MNQPSIRRIVLALSLSTLALTAPTALLAQNAVTGTDPCPKGMNCIANTANVSHTTPTSTSDNSTSTGSTIVQAILVFLGVA